MNHIWNTFPTADESRAAWSTPRCPVNIACRLIREVKAKLFDKAAPSILVFRFRGILGAAPEGTVLDRIVDAEDTGAQPCVDKSDDGFARSDVQLNTLCLEVCRIRQAPFYVMVMSKQSKSLRRNERGKWHFRPVNSCSAAAKEKLKKLQNGKRTPELFAIFRRHIIEHL